jgi:drug/metabolite transporter (DMT)-like permease
MKYLLTGALAGALFGTGAIVLKFAVSSAMLLMSPLFWVSIALAATGFWLSQVSIKNEKASNVMLMTITAEISLPVIGGILFFGEVLSLPEAVGIVLIVLAAALLILKGRSL